MAMPPEKKQNQYKSMDVSPVSQMFACHYHPAPLNTLSSSPTEPDSLEIHAPTSDPKN